MHWGLKSRRILRVVLELPSNLVGFFYPHFVSGVSWVCGGGGGVGAELGGAEGPITANPIQSIPRPRQISVK